MYLKNIEICGFKSFADKTRIEFDRQLTAIVGPNGCGKSNVVDAIRWCLGEQSAYSLRTQQMLGVIFNGSQTRPQLGLAEVSLTFDNSTGILPMDYTEITVTRKIFRSGESEYYINKIQCRLKDIRDLFLDTGIGRSGYSIFEQGKVEFIINAKPEERRALFEEAAGVAKYKVRREETLRKLERVREDTNRVNDIMSVIKEQTSALESAVRKARLYQKYVEELKTLQTADLVKKIERLGEELKPLSYSSEELNKKIIEFTTQADKLDVEISDLKIELTALEKEKSEISFSYTSTDTEIARCELRSQNFNTMIEEYTKRRTECRQNEKDFSSNIDLLKNQLEKVKSEIENFSSTLNKANKNFKEKDEKYKKIRSKISQTQSEKNRLNALVLDLVNKNASLSNEISSIQSEVTSLEVQQKSYAQELKKITAVRDATSREILSLQEEIKELNSLLEKETEEIQKLNSECEKITSEIKNSYEKLYGLKEKNLTLKARL
ncbi:MAG: AAA family ATPase, partial [Elusimicrobiota bacterium]